MIETWSPKISLRGLVQQCVLLMLKYTTKPYSAFSLVSYPNGPVFTQILCIFLFKAEESYATSGLSNVRLPWDISIY